MAISTLVSVQGGKGYLINYFDSFQDFHEINISVLSILKTSKTLKLTPFAVVSNSVLIDQNIDKQSLDKKYNILMFDAFKKGKNDIVCPSNIPLTITTVTRQLTFKVVDLNMQVQEDFNGVIHILLEFKCK